jgi:hypothetical protein
VPATQAEALEHLAAEPVGPAARLAKVVAKMKRPAARVAALESMLASDLRIYLVQEKKRSADLKLSGSIVNLFD